MTGTCWVIFLACAMLLGVGFALVIVGAFGGDPLRVGAAVVVGSVVTAMINLLTWIVSIALDAREKR